MRATQRTCLFLAQRAALRSAELGDPASWPASSAYARLAGRALVNGSAQPVGWHDSALASDRPAAIKLCGPQ